MCRVVAGLTGRVGGPVVAWLPSARPRVLGWRERPRMVVLPRRGGAARCRVAAWPGGDAQRDDATCGTSSRRTVRAAQPQEAVVDGPMVGAWPVRVVMVSVGADCPRAGPGRGVRGGAAWVANRTRLDDRAQAGPYTHKVRTSRPKTCWSANEFVRCGAASGRVVSRSAATGSATLLGWQRMDRASCGPPRPPGRRPRRLVVPKARSRSAAEKGA